MPAKDCVIPPSGPELSQLLKYFEREVFNQSQLAIWEDLHTVLLFHSTPGGSKTFSSVIEPGEQQMEHILQDVYGSNPKTVDGHVDSDD